MADGTATADELAVLALARDYEAALASGDAELALTYFDDGAHTSRFGPDGSQLDLAAVRALRRSTGPTADATWIVEQARALAPGVVLHLAVLERGGQTVQRTQVWAQRGGTWRVTHAHVSNPRTDR